MPHFQEQGSSWQCPAHPALNPLFCPKTTAPGMLWGKRYSMQKFPNKRHTFCHMDCLYLSHRYQEQYSPSDKVIGILNEGTRMVSVQKLNITI